MATSSALFPVLLFNFSSLQAWPNLNLGVVLEIFVFIPPKQECLENSIRLIITSGQLSTKL